MTAIDVFEGRSIWSAEQGDAIQWLKSLPTKSVSLVFFSGPYEDARTYGLGFRLKGQAWVDWMRPIVVESARVSAGLVAVNMSAKVSKCSYTAAVEWLVADLTRLDGLLCGPSPYAWVKSQNHEEADGNGIPGSGGAYYQRRDWEPIYCFALPDRIPGTSRNKDFFSDNTAFGHTPKYPAGGEMSNRMVNGVRVNDPWGTASRGPGQGPKNKDGEKPKNRAMPGPTRRANGEYKDVKRTHVTSGTDANGDHITKESYLPPKISNAGNVIRVPVGGSKLGCDVAHEGEAPMSIGVAERFICWFVPENGIVADPFVGTGTTIHAAVLHGRKGIGCDLRQSQIDLTTRRMAEHKESLGLFRNLIYGEPL